MRGVEANGELKPYTVIIDENGINAQGDHPAGMIVLSVGFFPTAYREFVGSILSDFLRGLFID